MEDKEPEYINTRAESPLGIVAGLVTVVLASGGATAWFTWRALNPKPPLVEFPTLESPPEDLAGSPSTTESPVEAPTAPTAPDKETGIPGSSG